MSPPATPQRREETGREETAERPAVSPTVARLVANTRYEPPKVASFPIDSMRVTEPVTLAGNS